MPKLQSANGRLNVLSKSGRFFYYLFLLFELCHITISLQERINNSSRPPRCGFVPHLHPQPLRQDFAEGTCLTRLRRELLACFCLCGFEKSGCLKPVGICAIQYTAEMRISVHGGMETQPPRLSKPASTEMPNYAAMYLRTKFLQEDARHPARGGDSPHTPEPTAEAAGQHHGRGKAEPEGRARRGWQGGQVSVTTTLTPAKATKSSCHLLPVKQEEDR